MVVDQEMKLAARDSRLISVNPRSRHEFFRAISLKNSKKNLAVHSEPLRAIRCCISTDRQSGEIKRVYLI